MVALASARRLLLLRELDVTDVERTLQDDAQLIELDRLRVPVDRAALDGEQRVVPALVARDHDDLGHGMRLDDLVEEDHALFGRSPRRLERDVERDDRGLLAAQEPPRLVGRGSRDDVVLLGQPPLQLIPDRLLVVDDQDLALAHAWSFPLPAPTGSSTVNVVP